MGISPDLAVVQNKANSQGQVLRCGLPRWAWQGGCPAAKRGCTRFLLAADYRLTGGGRMGFN